MNTFGQYLRLTTFGESHGPAMGGVLDGMPSRVFVDRDLMQRDLDRRSPGKGGTVSPRKEPDIPEILSGLSSDGYTLGTPVGFIIMNRDVRSGDYKDIENRFRPNHADYTYYAKYGVHDFRGGGRSSARETVSWVTAGAIVRQWLDGMGIEVSARFVETADIRQASCTGDSVGGAVECVVTGLPVGIGEPVFDKLHSRLAAAMMSINAAKAFEYGDGMESSKQFGSQCRDIPYVDEDGKVRFRSNHSGGIQGGISNGMPVNFKVYFKPTPTIPIEVESIDKDGNSVVIKPGGRHDVCVAVRAVPVVEAMTLLTIGDLILANSRFDSHSA